MMALDLIVIDPRPADLVPAHQAIPAMSDEAIALVYRFEDMNLAREQVLIVTDHLLHGGMYVRTVMVPAGVQITGALIKVPTILIVQGHAEVFIGEDVLELTGYNVVPAAAHRKQAIKARSDTYLTMFFPTDAKDVDTAERHFTDEFERLMSNSDPELNRTMITGE